MSQQELLDDWLAKKIEKFPHTKEFIEKSITEKQVGIVNGHIEWSTSFIKELNILENKKI
jgi:hypothetical protein